MDTVQKFCKENKLFRAGDVVLVGFSGGADSLMLLDYLWEHRQEMKISVAAVHVHHGIRKRTADEDAAFTAEFCREREIPYAVYHVDARAYAKNHHLSLEEAARILRFQSLEDAAQVARANKIALAHHQNDQAETILFQMMRGSGLKGLSGMEAKRQASRELGFTSKQVWVVRPLLCLDKGEIIAYLTEKGLSWREDETNRKDDASRNRIRHHALPELEKVRADAAKKIAEAGAYVGDVDRMLREEADLWVMDHEVLKRSGRSGRYIEEEEHNSYRMEHGTIEVNAEAFLKLPKVRREYVVTSALRFLQYPMKDIGRVHIDAMAEIAEKAVGKCFRIPGGGMVKRTYETLRFVRHAKEDDAEVEDGVDGSIRITEFPAEPGQTFPKNEYTKWFDCGKIKGTPILRTRERGDRFSTGPGTHKKLSDYFIDEKIPREDRDRVPVVAVGSDVLWVVGYRMSEEFKVTEQTENICQIEFMK